MIDDYVHHLYNAYVHEQYTFVYSAVVVDNQQEARHNGKHTREKSVDHNFTSN